VFLEGTNLLICGSDMKKTKIEMGNTPNDKTAFLCMFLAVLERSTLTPSVKKHWNS
jgi:hypothetical protein